MDYSTFDAEDFLLDPAFVQWVREGQNDDLWQAFLIEHPSQGAAVQQARLAITSVKSLPVIALDARDKTEIWKGIADRISQVDGPSKRQINVFTLWKWVSAAVVVVSMLVGWQLFSKRAGQEKVSYDELISAAKVGGPELVERVNTGAEVLPVRLPDGSSVFLHPGSRLSYAVESFEGPKREVYVSGEAFFEVTKNPEKPFFVYANELVTRVLGTSFTVRAFPDDMQVEVMVKTGKVSVFTSALIYNQRGEGGELQGAVVLTPNQQVTLQRDGMTLSRSLVSKPEILSREDMAINNFEFDDEFVGNVFNKLDQAYGVDIIYDEDLLRDCKITASLTNEPLYEKIRLICEGLGAKYEVIDARVVIHSTGCK